MNKHFKTVPFGTFNALVDPLNMNDSQLSESLGYTSGAMYAWRNKGQVPRVAFIAAKTLANKDTVSKMGKRDLMVRTQGDFQIYHRTAKMEFIRKTDDGSKFYLITM